jgi:glucose/mannose-6-phosphate isomerase
MSKDLLKLQSQYDKNDMYGKISGMPGDLETGLDIGRKADLLGLENKTYNSIILAGMGGSAIAGDIARSFLSSSMKIPFIIQRNYRLPEFVNKKSLILCSSYSGNTEETLSAFQDAVSREASIVAITTGGELEKKAKSKNIPVVKIPPGLPPRAALGLSFSPLMVLLSRFGFIDIYDNEIRQVANTMRERLLGYSIESKINDAVETARIFYGKIPIIYAGVDHLDSAAVRFKGQICENSKCLAFANVFPEFNHNELVGWQKLYDFDKKIIAVIIKDSDDNIRNQHRMNIVAEYLRDYGREVIEIEESKGKFLERMFLLIQKFDYISYYLALMNGFDPTPVGPIDYLKGKLSEVK